MKDKYYTPEAGELTIGMEVELLHSTNGWVKYINPDIKPLDANSLKEGVRVRYLDREDIESLEFKHKYGKENNPNICFTKKIDSLKRNWDTVDIIHNPISKWVLICLGNDETVWSDWDTVFAGTLKNKSELINQLKRCGI